MKIISFDCLHNLKIMHNENSCGNRTWHKISCKSYYTSLLSWNLLVKKASPVIRIYCKIKSIEKQLFKFLIQTIQSKLRIRTWLAQMTFFYFGVVFCTSCFKSDSKGPILTIAPFIKVYSTFMSLKSVCLKFIHKWCHAIFWSFLTRLLVLRPYYCRHKILITPSPLSSWRHLRTTPKIWPR
jgi:hypothetical protein